MIASLAELHRQRPQPLVTETFEVWRTGLTSAPVGEFTTFDEAVGRGASAVGHKGFFLVRQTIALTGATILHFFTVKRSSKQHVYRQALDGDYRVKEGALEAVFLTNMAYTGDFQPVQPWRWTPEDHCGNAHRRLTGQDKA